MSGIWMDFDPLAHKRGKPAAPVTSMEQAEVLPVSGGHSDEANQVDTSAGSGNNQSGVEANSKKGTDLENKDPSSNNQIGTDESPSKNTSKEAITNRVDEEDGNNNKITETSKMDDDEVSPKDKSVSPIESQTQHDDQNTGNQEEATNGLFDGIDSESNHSISKTPSEPPHETVNPEKQEPEDTNWPPDSNDLSFEAEDLHSGDLRKNSIAAMEKLGNPIATSISSDTSDDDNAVTSFDFQKFMDCLRAKSADPIARYIKSFLQEFSRAVWTPTQQEKIISDFHKFISVKLRDYEPFASMSKRERLNSLEGVEKLIMNRLYARTFSPKMPPIIRTDGHNEDLLNDQVFEEKMRLWGWVEGRHLDINEEYLKSQFIHLATTELGRLHQFKSPRDKMICILNCSKVIYALIRQARLEQNADSFLPLLIYVVLKAHPVHLVSTINYIQRFRAKEFQRGETAYYLSTLASAVTFVETLDHSSLTISSEEFEQRMTDAVLAEKNRKSQQQKETELLNDGDNVVHEGESSAAVLTASAGMLVDRMRKLTSKFLEDLASPEEESSTSPEAQPRTQSQPHSRNSRSQQLSNYRNEEQAAREASREEYKVEQAQREQFNETSGMLQNMFPSLDKDLIEDVLRQNGTNVGSAVDVCLALVG